MSRQTDAYRNKRTDRHSQTKRLIDRQTEIPMDRQIDRHIVTGTKRQTDKRTNPWINEKKQTDRQTGSF